VRPDQDLHGGMHAMPIACVQPERLLDERAHRRQQPVAREVEPMSEPSLLDEKAHEVAGERRVTAALKELTLYRASMAEWARDESLPIERG
jgi:hypothetical protein